MVEHVTSSILNSTSSNAKRKYLEKKIVSVLNIGQST